MTRSRQPSESMTVEWRHPAAAMYAGVARCDITLPVGMYARMWGAALHDRAEGVHQPLTATVLVFRDRPDAAPLLLVSLDWVFVAGRRELEILRKPLLPMVGGDAARLILACTHTHAAGKIALECGDLPGGEMIAPYLDRTAESLRAAAGAALADSQQQPCTLAWATGRCGLAANRDLPAPDGSRDICGFNPAAPADDTLLVGRLTRHTDGQTIATLVNYACHPTTLAWENRLVSPDFIGAMRALVETATHDAPCAFLQGASGELAPRLQYVGDPAIPEAHGRQLGYAVLSTLEGMLPPRTKLVMQGVVESGAPLAVWRPGPDAASETVAATCTPIDLPLKPAPPLAELEARFAASTDRVESERLRRRIAQMKEVGTGETAAMPAWAWRLGDTLLLAHPNEAYSDLQQALRARFTDHAVVVMNVANGWSGYLYPRLIAHRNNYAVWQSPFQAEALEVLIDRSSHALASLIPDTAAG